MDRSNDLLIDGLMDWWTVHRHWLYRQKYLPPSKGYCQCGLSLLQIRISCPTGILFFFGTEEFAAREGSDNLAVSIRTTTSCKCRRKRWFVLYAFLWTCRETVKYQALEIVYRTYSGALKEWWVKWKVSVGEVHKPKVRCTSANSPTRCSCTVICWHHWLLPWHHCFYD